MAIQFVGYTSFKGPGTNAYYNTISLTGLTGGIRSSVQKGDLIIASYGIAATVYKDPKIVDADYVPYTTLINDSKASSVTASLHMAYKFAGNTPDTEVRFWHSGGVNNARVQFVYVFSGVDYEDMLDVPIVVTSRTGGIVDPGKVIQDSADICIVIAGVSSMGDVASGSLPFTDPSGKWSDFHSLAQRDERSNVMGAGYKVSEDGQFDPPEWGWPGATSTEGMATINAMVPLKKYVPYTDTGIRYVGGASATRSAISSDTTPLILRLDRAYFTGGWRPYLEAGDLVVVTVAQSSDGDRSPTVSDGTSDYTFLTNVTATSSGGRKQNLRVYYKFMGSTPDTTLQVSAPGSSGDSQFISYMVFSGVDQTQPWDVPSQVVANNTSGLPTPPSITPITPGAWPLAVSATVHEQGIFTYTAAPGLTKYITAGHNSTFDVTGGFGFDDSWSSGAKTFSQWSAGFTDTALASSSITMALRPEVPDTGTGGKIKVFDGTAFTPKPIKVWDGTSWVTKPLYRWNGSAWIKTPY